MRLLWTKGWDNNLDRCESQEVHIIQSEEK